MTDVTHTPTESVIKGSGFNSRGGGFTRVHINGAKYEADEVARRVEVFPELLEALEEAVVLLEQLGAHDGPNTILEQARDVAAKARGQS